MSLYGFSFFFPFSFGHVYLHISPPHSVVVSLLVSTFCFRKYQPNPYFFLFRFLTNGCSLADTRTAAALLTYFPPIFFFLVFLLSTAILYTFSPSSSCLATKFSSTTFHHRSRATRCIVEKSPSGARLSAKS